MLTVDTIIIYIECLAGIEALKHSFPQSMASWMTTWPVLGLLFMVAGLSHFSSAEGTHIFINIFVQAYYQIN